MRLLANLEQLWITRINDNRATPNISSYMQGLCTSCGTGSHVAMDVTTPFPPFAHAISGEGLDYPDQE